MKAYWQVSMWVVKSFACGLFVHHHPWWGWQDRLPFPAEGTEGQRDFSRAFPRHSQGTPRGGTARWRGHICAHLLVLCSFQPPNASPAMNQHWFGVGGWRGGTLDLSFYKTFHLLVQLLMWHVKARNAQVDDPSSLYWFAHVVGKRAFAQ